MRRCRFRRAPWSDLLLQPRRVAVPHPRPAALLPTCRREDAMAAMEPEPNFIFFAAGDHTARSHCMFPRPNQMDSPRHADAPGTLANRSHAAVSPPASSQTTGPPCHFRAGPVQARPIFRAGPGRPSCLVSRPDPAHKLCRAGPTRLCSGRVVLGPSRAMLCLGRPKKYSPKSQL